MSVELPEMSAEAGPSNAPAGAPQGAQASLQPLASDANGALNGDGSEAATGLRPPPAIGDAPASTDDAAAAGQGGQAYTLDGADSASDVEHLTTEHRPALNGHHDAEAAAPHATSIHLNGHAQGASTEARGTGAADESIDSIMLDAEAEASSSAAYDHPYPSPSYRHVATLFGHTRAVSSLSFSPDGSRLLSTGADNMLKIWSVRTGAIIHTMQGHEEGISQACWSADSQYVASASDDLTVRIWDTQSGKQIRVLRGHTSYVLCVAFNPQGTLLASGGFDESLRFWDVRKGKLHRLVSAHTDGICAVDFNREGTIAVTCSYDGLIRVWDVTCGQCLKTLVPIEQLGSWNTPVTSVVFAPSSVHLLASSLDGKIRLWDIPNGRVLKTYEGHKAEKYATSAHFSQPRWSVRARSAALLKPHEGGGAGARQPQQQQVVPSRRAEEDVRLDPRRTADWTAEEVEEAKRKIIASERRREARNGLPEIMVISGSEDQKVYIWDAQTKEVLQTLTGHADSVVAVALHPFEPIIASGALDHDLGIRLWMDLSADL